MDIVKRDQLLEVKVCQLKVFYTSPDLDGLMKLWLMRSDVYLVGTVMLIFGMGLYGLFISNGTYDPESDRALENTTLFGMFALKVKHDPPLLKSPPACHFVLCDP